MTIDTNTLNRLTGIFDTSSLEISEVRYTATGGVEYLGVAAPGSTILEPKWKIKKFFFDSQGRITHSRFSNGSLLYNAIFENRDSLDYS